MERSVVKDVFVEANWLPTSGYTSASVNLFPLRCCQVTVDAADIVLVRNDLRDLLVPRPGDSWIMESTKLAAKAFFALAKETLRTIWFNFLWLDEMLV